MVADGEAALWTNVPEPMQLRLDDGIYGLSNGRLSGRWPKVAVLEAQLAEWMELNRTTAGLLDLLMSSAPFDPLPDEPGSGTPLFIHNSVYGTRCSTVVAVTASGAGSIVERRFNEAGNVTGETHMQFQ